ncbi:MAG TPA: FG-GAP-like repeat-containing protein, partial [Vicinamibacterales bacterium]|nr:FG-GAP-like repeat-containing protein [Vicinamibacterales bacterium]
TAVALGDLDGDGDLDAYDVIFGAGDRIWLNDGQGNFTDSGQALGNDAGNDVSLFDFDGDGDLDAFVANAGANKIWLNAGDGTMIDSGIRMGTATSFGLSLGDVDGDGDTDAFIANEGPNSVWLLEGLDAGDRDSDGDGMHDGWEVDHGLDPLADTDDDIDSDADGLSNTGEFDAGTDPHVPDSDGDGMPDGFESENGLDPLSDDANLDLDRDGVSNLIEFQSGGAVYGDDVPPELSAPDDVSTDSTGQLTSVELGSAVAVDARDGAVSATADDAGPFLPGAHLVTWSASDLSGNLARDTQAVDVVPQVSFATDQLADEGDVVEVVLELNGPAASYPVQVNYTVTGVATNPGDHDAADGSVMIESGTSAVIPINIVADAIFEGEEKFTLTMTETVNAVPGPQRTQTISITQANVMPVARIVAEQRGRTVTTVTRDGGPVTIHAEIDDPNSGDSHSLDWSISDSGAFDPADARDQGYTIDPATLNAGFYRIAVLLADTGVPAALNRADTIVRVVSTAPALPAGEDSDRDGVDDATEGFGDGDGDRIPDHLDAFPAGNVLSYAGDNRVLETQPGLFLRLGESAFRNGRFAGVPESAVLEEVEYGYPNGLADFEILGVEPGTAARIVLPLEHPVPANARYRKFMGAGWQDFAIDAGNAIASAPGSNGACPAPGSTAWVDGLTTGHGCLQLTIEDGGANDSDLAVNGVIRDPGGLAVPVGVSLSILAVPDRDVASGSDGNVVLALRLGSDSGD